MTIHSPFSIHPHHHSLPQLLGGPDRHLQTHHSPPHPLLGELLWTSLLPSSLPSSRPSCLPSSLPSSRPSCLPFSLPSSRSSSLPSLQLSSHASLLPSSLPWLQ